jgi:hypothetical protein
MGGSLGGRNIGRVTRGLIRLKPHIFITGGSGAFVLAGQNSALAPLSPGQLSALYLRGDSSYHGARSHAKASFNADRADETGAFRYRPMRRRSGKNKGIVL